MTPIDFFCLFNKKQLNLKQGESVLPDAMSFKTTFSRYYYYFVCKSDGDGWRYNGGGGRKKSLLWRRNLKQEQTHSEGALLLIGEEQGEEVIYHTFKCMRYENV